MTTFTLQKERKEDQIRTYVLIERNSDGRLRTRLLILSLLGALTFLAVGGAKRAGKTLFEAAPFRSNNGLERGRVNR
jgi:hypothetical protein